MPPPPELRDAGGDVGIVEVFYKMEPEDTAQTDGHIAVTGKVEVKVQHIGCGVKPDEQDGDVRGAFVGGDQFIEDIGQQYLFGKAEDEAAGAVGGIGQRVGAMLQLGGDIRVPDDGPGDELGEHGHIRGKVNEIPLGSHIAPVYVDDVAQNLEGVKADADGQGHMEQREGQPGEGVEAADEKVGVLAVAQKSQTDNGGGPQAQLGPFGSVTEFFSQQAEYITLYDGDDHKHHEARLAPGIEEQTAEQQHCIFQPAGDQKVQDQDAG